MICAGFLSPVYRADLIALARDGWAAHRLSRRANALVLLDFRAECRGYDGHETTDRTEEINNAPSGPPMRGAAFDS